MSSLRLLVAIVAAVVSSNAHAGGYWDEWNLAELQRYYAKGVADPEPWAGWWWPYTENGIADRSIDDEKLSPADRLDRALGNGYWIAAWEYSNHGHGTYAQDWWGHCNGWATAAIMEPEPRSAKTVNNVKFDIQDRKGILSEYWLQSGSDFIGNRVYNSGDTQSYAFWDIVPAQFHLLMTNLLGRQKRSMIVDRHTGYEVWNHPVIAYEIKPIKADDYLGRDPQYSNVYRVNVSAVLWMVNDDVEVDDVTPKFDWKENDFFSKRELRYELWVDAPLEFDSKGNLKKSGNIILTNQGHGGVWKNASSYPAILHTHPDFVWVPLSYAASSGYKNPRLNDGWVNKYLTGR